MINYSSFISNSIFCNDRSIPNQIASNGNGYNIEPDTYYGAYYKIRNQKDPSLICPLVNDMFTIKKSELVMKN